MLVNWYSNLVLKRMHSPEVDCCDLDLNLEDVKRIAVLFEATDLNSIKLVKKFVRMLASSKYEINALGYVNKAHKSLEHLSTLYFDYFSKAQLNWYGKPKGMVIDNFLDEDYDVLIDLSLKSHYPLTYLTLASSAVYKVGRFRKDICIFDHEIKMNKFQSLDSLIKEVTHCLIPTEGYDYRYRKNRSCVNNSLQGR